MHKMSGTQIRREYFYQILPSKILGDMKKECRGGKSKACETKQLHMDYHTSQILRHV